ncbi:hypothetical protein DID88_007815 [Monilinia fructigena]|uniref:HMA domain-containing protein n=1 Tax=Monilinia fructigena TaxID=38457 RepID=A0A395J3E9_9HELO|nr:hypothetical protein DID88_007815 [Monilinia fructigena]
MDPKNEVSIDSIISITNNKDTNSINSYEFEKMNNILTREDNSAWITTSYLLSNLHCPSCVSNIQKALYALCPRPKDVTPSLMSSWVTVQHEKSLSTKAIREALQFAGFDVCDVTSEDDGSVTRSHILHDTDTGYLDHVLQRWTATTTTKRTSSQLPLPHLDSYSDRHLENCEICRREAATGDNVSKKSVSANVQKNLGQSDIHPIIYPGLPGPAHADGSNSKGSDGAADKRMSDDGRINPLVVVDSISSSTFRASLAIGGMTCAACANNIVVGLKKNSWVKDVVVNLISNSATVDFDDEKHTSQIVEEIEDLGYDAALDSVIDLKPEPQKQKVLRTVEIMVEGIYCGHCPPRINDSMKSFGDRVTVERALSLDNPILKISYIPSAPNFTIRQILAKISAVEEGFIPTIYHPPTIEERSRMIHKREQKTNTVSTSQGLMMRLQCWGNLRPTEALLVVVPDSEEHSRATNGQGDLVGDFTIPYSDDNSRTSHQEGIIIKSVNVDLLEFDDIIKVLHGGSPACDGKIIKGETRFDESSLTGEAKLVKKSSESLAWLVLQCSIKIVKAVREGQTKRAPMERIADTLTGYFVPVITLIAIVTFFVWLSLGLSEVLPDAYRGSSGWVVWSLQFAIAVFVVACPCGLALAAPTALFVGGGLAAHHGILVKGGGEAFEKASMLDCIVFDKTGTLTQRGEPTVTDYEFVDGVMKGMPLGTMARVPRALLISQKMTFSQTT